MSSVHHDRHRSTRALPWQRVGTAGRMQLSWLTQHRRHGAHMRFRFLYGGAAPSDEGACKGMMADLRGAVHYARYRSKGICVPIQAVIEYRGER